MDIIKEVENYTIQYFKENIPSTLSYHSIEHTKLVAGVCAKLAEAENLEKKDKERVLVAAWFHDIGYAVSHKNHEEESCKIARNFLQEKNTPEEFIADVETCILSTKVGMEKKNVIEMILSDADHAHAGMKNFMEISGLYRKEVSSIIDKKQSKLDYWKNTLIFLKKIKFLTQYAKENMESVKDENIKKVEKRINKLKAEKPILPPVNKKTTARGIETMFRLTARNQINLSSIADNKANIMVTINAIIVSILVSTSAMKFSVGGGGGEFIVPGLILVTGCLISLVFAILSVRPKFSNGKFSEEDLKNRNVNLLFFGNFFKMEYPKYEKGIKEMMDDYDFLYSSLIKDQYNLGKVLSLKYRLLSYSYNFFMFSFVSAVIVFFTMYFTKY